MANVRIRSVWLALLFGEFGVDLLLLRGHQMRLFLFLGGLCWAAILVGLIGLASTSHTGWAVLAILGGGLLALWRWARFFEYLNLTDEQFENLLETSNAN